ncbi:MAG: EamA family transporter [Chitinophagaceae bacterium]|nr:EamA family transporter [Chitinophagaceae bacterium]
MTEPVLVATAVALRIISNPLANVFQKQLTAVGNHPLVVNFLTYFILSLFCVVVVFFLEVPPLNSQFWLYAILGGIAGALGNGFMVKALQIGDLSVLGPINSYKSVVGIIVGIFLLSEIPNLWGLLGIVLIIYGSHFVLDATPDARFSWKLLEKPEIRFRIWAMILTAIEAVFVKKIILASSTTTAFMSWCIFGALFSFFLLFFNRLDVQPVFSRGLRFKYYYKFLLLVTCVGIMTFTTNYVFDHMPVGYALSLFQLSTMVSILFGYKFFSEREIGKKVLGAAIMIAGSVMIILLK